MRRITLALLMGSLLIAGAAVFFTPRASAQWAGGGGPVEVVGTVAVQPGDGGLLPVDLQSSIRLDTSVTTPPGSWLAVAADSSGTRLGVDVSGPSGAPVEVAGVGGGNVNVAGTVSLSGATQAALSNLINGTPCTFGAAKHFILSTTNFDGGFTYVPPLLSDGGYPSLASRSEIAIATEGGGSGHLYAFPESGDAGVPECTSADGGALGAGFIIEHGSTLTLRAGSTNRVSIIGCTNADVPGGTHHVSYLESSCVQ